MATQKKINLSINFSTNIKALQEANQALANIMQNSTLLSREGNTLKSIYNNSGSLLKKMTDLQKDNGTITVTELKRMQAEYDKITSAINSIQQAESLAYKKQEENLKQAVEQQKKYQKELKTTKEELKTLTASTPKTEATEGTQFTLNQVKKNNQLTDFQSLLLEQPDFEKQISVFASQSLKTNPFAKNKSLTKEEVSKRFEEYKKEIEEARELEKIIKEERERQKEITAEYEKQVQLLQERVNLAQQNVNASGEEVTRLQNSLNASSASTAHLKDMEDKLATGHEALTKKIKALNEAGQKQAKVNEKVESVTQKLLKTSLAHKMLMNGIQKIFKASVDAVVKMDKALTDMSIATGMSRKETYALIPELNRLGQEAGAVATDMAALTAEYIKQGRSVKDSMSLATTTAKAAKISGLSTADTVQYMTSAINGFNLSAKDATRVSDVFAKTAAATATDFKDLAIALSKVGAQANSAGMSIEFTTALLAKGMETTQEAPESIGTALKTVVARMRELSDYGSVLEDDTSINKVERALDAVGVSLRNSNGEFRDLEEVFTELGPKWDNINTMQQQAIAQAVAGTRQQSRFLAIMQDWDRTLEISAVTLDSAGASAYQFSQYTHSLEYYTTNLSNAWQGMVANLANVDVIRDGLGMITELLNGLNDFLQLGDGMVGSYTAVTLAVIAIGSAWRKNRQAMILNTEQLIQQQMLTKDMSREQAIAYLNENKLLSVRQKLYLLKEKEYNMAKKESALTKIELGQTQKQVNLNNKQAKQLDNMLKDETDIKEITDFRTKKGKELQAWGKKNNLTDEETKKLAAETLALQQTGVTLEQATITNKLIEQGLTQDEINDAMTLLTMEGLDLSLEQASAIAKARKNGELTKEWLIQNGITNEVQQQAILEGMKNTQKKTGLGLSIKEMFQGVKNTMVNLASGIAKAWSTLGPVAGSIAAGILATIVGGIIGTSIAGANRKAKEEAVSKNQDTIYENKENKTKVTSLKTEYEELWNLKESGMADSEDIERLYAIEEELKEIDNTLIGTGQELIDTMNSYVDSLDSENRELAKENKQNVTELATEFRGQEFWAHFGLAFADIATLGIGAAFGWHGAAQESMKKDQAKEVLGDENNQLALRQAASYTAMDLVASSPEELQRKVLNEVDALYAKMDWDAFSDKYYDDLDNKLSSIEKLYTNAVYDIAKASESTTTPLTKQIEAYQKNLQSLTSEFGEGSDIVKDYTQQYQNLNNLSENKETIRTLENQGFESNEILKLLSSLKQINVSGQSAADILSLIASKGGDFNVALDSFIDELINKKYDYSDAGLNYWAQLGGKDVAELQRWKQEDPVQLANYIQTLIDGFQDLATGGINASNIKTYRDKVISKQENLTDITTNIAEGKLTTENKDYLAEHFGDLYAREDFQEALKNNSSKAVTMILNAANKEIEDTVKDATASLETERDEQQESLRQYGFTDYQEFIDFLDKSTEKQIEAKFGKDWKSVAAQIKTRQIDIQTLTDSIEELNYGFGESNEIDAYTAAMSQLEAQISATEEAMSDIESGNLNSLVTLGKLYSEQMTLAQSQFNNKLQTTATAMNLTVEELKNYYSIVNGKIIPNTNKLNNLLPEQRAAWLANVEGLDEYANAADEALDAIKELQQQAVDDAIANQEFYLEHMKSAYEKEAEALKESLDERKEMYDKYFDALEGEEETQDYEKERQTLINRIAKLSTATDSESLKQLKEAQQELGELNKEYNSSQREQRREAVSTRLDEASENIDKKLEEILADGNELWKEWINQAKSLDEESAKAWLSSLGQFDGMTDLMIDNFMKGEWLDNKVTFDSYVNSGYTFDGITNAILEGIKQAPVTTTTENGDAINNQVSATIESIVIGENTNYSTEEIKELVQKAFEDSWSAIATQWGINLNRKE